MILYTMHFKINCPFGADPRLKICFYRAGRHDINIIWR